MGGVSKNQFIARDSQKGEFGQFADLRGGLVKKRDSVFERRLIPNAHYDVMVHLEGYFLQFIVHPVVYIDSFLEL